MPQITRKLEFDSGHRVLGHEGKCKHLHGHRYVAEITVSSLALDDISRVVDFSVIKTKVGGWIDDHWDHNMLLNERDPLWYASSDNAAVFAGKTPYVMLNGENPTAEVIAQELFDVATQLLRDNRISVESVRIYETPNCWADYGRESNEEKHSTSGKI